MAGILESFRLDGKLAIVTGSERGLGQGYAAALAQAGADVLGVTQADESAASGTAADVRAAGRRYAHLKADLASLEPIPGIVESALREFGRIDILVNNVGGTIWAMPYARYAEAQIEAEIRRSLFPTLWCCRAVLPAMLEAGGGGAIVNVSSVATRGVNRVPYAAAKGGVNALTACLAWEYAEHGIRVNAVAPGGTEAPPRRIPRNVAAAAAAAAAGEQSAQERGWWQEVVEQTKASSLMHRYGTTEEQAAAILFLASDEASYIKIGRAHV